MAPLLDDLDRRRESADQTRENSARLASSYAQFTTVGQGTVHYDERIDFGITFVEQPIPSHTCSVDMDQMAETLGIDDVHAEVPLPIATGYVTSWDQDDRDFYVGCWVSVRISFPSIDFIDPTKPIKVQHHFTFSAIGTKNIPLDLTDAVEG